MVFIATITSPESAVGNVSDNLQHADGEISIAFWSFVFVLLFIVTVWFYITQIAPMQRSVRQVEEVDKEEEVAKRILEHLSSDLQFKNEKSNEQVLENASPVGVTKLADSSIYEYVDDEIHIHYSQYSWDDDSETDFQVASGAARRHSMENMDLIFPGVLPSIVEEEEYDEESDTDFSEKSQETDLHFGGRQCDADFTNFPMIYKSNGNNNVESMKHLLIKEQDNLDMETNIAISLDNQELQAQHSTAKQDRVVVVDNQRVNSSRSLFGSAEGNNVPNIKSSLEAVKVGQNCTSSLSCRTNNITQGEGAENYRISSSGDPHHIHKEIESVIAKADFTSGSDGASSDKDDNCSQIIQKKSHDDMMEKTSMFTLSGCEVKPRFKRDANEFEDYEVKLCASTCSIQKIPCSAENGLDEHSTRDFSFKYATNTEHLMRNNISKSVNKPVMEDTRGLTSINEEDTNKSQVAQFLLNGVGDDIADSNGHTTHAWTFFSMSDDYEAAAREKENLEKDLQSDTVEIPSIIVDSYDEGLPSDKSIADVDAMAAMNGYDITSRYGNSFETDIDIDDIDLIDSDKLEDEGDLSIYFKRHVSVTDLDKILTEEGKDNQSNCDAGEVLETDLSLEDPRGERTEIDRSRTRNEVLQNTEMDDSCTATEITYINDETDMNIKKSAIVSTTLSNCLEVQASDEDIDDTDSSDNSLPKSFTVESLFDGVSFQKDGVYGELVLSQLNENQGNKMVESSFDSHDDDWYGFSEEIRRERKPFLFTIPEDEEIGFAEFDGIVENCFVGAIDNPIYDNEVTPTKETEKWQLLNAPIATVETFDSDTDVDEMEKSSKCETEKYDGDVAESKQMLEVTVTHDGDLTELNIMDGVSNQEENKKKNDSVTESSGKIDSANVKDSTRSVKTEFDLDGMEQGSESEKENHYGETVANGEMVENRADNAVMEIKRIDGARNLAEVKNKNSVNLPTNVSNRDDLIEDSGNLSSANLETKDTPRSVKIVKKIKIFVRKEVTFAKDGDIMEDITVNPKLFSDDVSMKEVTEDNILACCEANTHHPFEPVKSEISPVNQLMKCMTSEEEKCYSKEIVAKNLEVVTKILQYIPNEFEPIAVSEEVVLPCVEVDTQSSARKDHVIVDAKDVVKTVYDTTEVQLPPMEVQGSECDIAQNNNATTTVRTKSNVVAQTVMTETNVEAKEIMGTADATPLAIETNKTKTVAVKEETSKAAEDPNRSNKDVTEHTPIQSQESSSVKINVHGTRSQIGNRESKNLRPFRVSPKHLEKEPRKVYLSSCNIRLTKSHEDLRFVDRTPERKEQSIKEEEIPDTRQSLHSEHSPMLPISELNHLVLEEDVFKPVEPPSLHTAKITVEEVLGDRQRIVILNVKKKVHGKGRWKSLNDLDSIKMAFSPPRRSSDLGIDFAGLPEEEERIEEGEMQGKKKAFIQIAPVVEIEKSGQECKCFPEMEPAGQSFESPVLNVTALQSCESTSESEVKKKTIKESVIPVLQKESLQRGPSVTEKKSQALSSSKLPLIKATPVHNCETNTNSKEKPKLVKATVTSALNENPVETKSEAEANETMKIEEEIGTNTSRKSPEEDNKTLIDGAFIAEENVKNRKQPKRITRVHDMSRVEVIPQLEKETVTEITDESTKGNKIKIHVSHRVSPPDKKEDIHHHVPPVVKETLHRRHEVEGSLTEMPSTVDVSRRQERESGYGSLGVSPFASINTRVNNVFVLEGANEHSVSSLSSIDGEEYGGEILGDSKIMVTDLDALLSQQGAEQSFNADIEKAEAKEKVRVVARMEPVPEKVVRIDKKEDEDSLVIRHINHEEPIVVQPIIIADTAKQEESQVISAFLVNDGYDDDELDEVFLEEYTPYHEPDSSSCRTYSSDADSETSSVNSLPLKHRHRHTRAALEAGKGAMRNRTESSGSSKTATPVAELENANAPISSGTNMPQSNAHKISPEKSFSHHMPELTQTAGVEEPSEFTSAFTPVFRTGEFLRPRARSYGHKSDEEIVVQNRHLGTSLLDVQAFPGLSVDKERFKEAADSRKSMPDLSISKGHTLNDSPYLRGLSAHTRRWLSQNVWMDSNMQQQEEDLMTSDMFLYPSNRFQPGSNINASFLSLANERDFPDDISVSTLSTRPQSPMSEFSFAGETPYWGLRRDSTTVIKCSNPRCEKEEVLFGGEKTTYTSCPACFTYYCARACRRIHWSEHKKVCFFGRINSYVRSFIYLCHKKEALKFQLSQTAKDGYKKKERGSVMVTFASAQLARKFMTTGCTFFPSPPTYSSLVNVQAEGVISKHKIALMQHIKDYQPEEEFVLNLAIIAGKMEDLPANPVPRRKVSTVLQVVKIPLSGKLKETSPSQSLPNDPNTETKVFYLPKCSRHEFVNDNEARRHYCRNISKNLKQYGIRLKHDYPDVYEKLCRYVDQNIRFTEPLTVYGNHGKKIIMCKIMPEAGNDESNA